MSNFYVYVYLNTMKPGCYIYNNIEFNYEPFYVCKGKNNRYLYHLNKVKNKNKYKSSSKFSIIEECIYNNIEPIIIKLYDNLDEDTSLILEKETILTIGRMDLSKGPLTNRNDGGLKPQDNYRHSESAKKNISIGLRRSSPRDRYDLISPDNKKINNVNLLDFCKINNLDYQKMRKSSNKGCIKVRKTINCNKETLNCENWQVINKKIYKHDNRKLKYILISPDNQEYKVYNDQSIKNVANELNLNLRLLRLYRNKGKIEIKSINQCKEQKSLNCQGWQFNDLNKKEIIIKSEGKVKWLLIDRYDTTYEIINLKKFCQDNNLSERTFRTFKNKGIIDIKIRKNYKENILNTIGWECRSI